MLELSDGRTVLFIDPRTIGSVSHRPEGNRWRVNLVTADTTHTMLTDAETCFGLLRYLGVSR
jgi:hypothetical protein